MNNKIDMDLVKKSKSTFDNFSDYCLHFDNSDAADLVEMFSPELLRCIGNAMLAHITTEDFDRNEMCELFIQSCRQHADRFFEICEGQYHEN